MLLTRKCSRCGEEKTYMLTIDEFEYYKDLDLCVECEEYMNTNARTILKETIDSYENELMGLRMQDDRRVEHIKSIVKNLRKAVDHLERNTDD